MPTDCPHEIAHFHCHRCDDVVEDCRLCHICEEYWAQLLEEADQLTLHEDEEPEDCYNDCGD